MKGRKIIETTIDVSNHQALVSSLLGCCIVLIGWLASKLLDSSKKEIREIKEDLKEIRKDQHLMALSHKQLEGQMTLALSMPKELDELKKEVWSVEAKTDAAWRVIDKKRTSDS